ncbi:hypothetical protein J4G07_17050 [Candidatus Poribacteria bacterium]|nr:hypothetical protein [Candidatus Poribacteria bacterium]
MAYSDFTLESVVTTFQLERIEVDNIFSETEPVVPSSHLTSALARNVSLAVAIGTEKGGSFQAWSPKKRKEKVDTHGNPSPGVKCKNGMKTENF